MTADDLDPTSGPYIHRREDRRPEGTRTITITDENGVQEWVHADDFMAVQRNRDDLRRELALINAQVHAAVSAHEVRGYVERTLWRLGFTPEDGATMLAIIREFGPASSRAAGPRDADSGCPNGSACSSPWCSCSEQS